MHSIYLGAAAAARSATLCYACGKPLIDKGEAPPQAVLADDDGRSVPVGPDCLRRIVRAGAQGYVPPRGGPRLFGDILSREQWLAQRC